MEYKLNRVVRAGLTNDCQLVEGTIQLADYDADLNIVFPGGQRAVLQWRVEGPTLDICFDQPVDVFNDGPNMQPAPANQSRPENHIGVVQLVIPLSPEYAEGQHTKDNNCPNCGQPDDHTHPDKDTDGRCRNCCPMCIQSNEEEAKV